MTRRNLALSAACLAALAATLSTPRSARATGFAEPPGRQRVARAYTAESPDHDGFLDEWPPPRRSLVRLFVGPAGRFDASGAAPGLLVAAELGRGPTGGRLAATWIDVGSASGVSQYTGELTIDFGGRSFLRPVIGAGGGVARTSWSVRDDGSRDESSGATLGIGLVRGSLGVRLPFDDADARVALDLTGVLPAIRSAHAPELTPWGLASIHVGIGF